MLRLRNKTRWRAAFRRNSETIFIRRYTGSGANRTSTDFEVRARVTGFQPHQLIGSIVQGDRNVTVLAEDVVGVGFALPVTLSDKIVVRGRELAVFSVDDSTRRDGGELIALEIKVRG